MHQIRKVEPILLPERNSNHSAPLSKIETAFNHINQSGPRKKSCIFCQIVKGEAPATILAQWPNALAIKPLKQVTDDHALIIPKIHVEDYTSRPEVSALVMMAAAEYAPHPSNIWSSAGAVASQTVFHLHIHVLPRSENDGMMLPQERD